MSYLGNRPAAGDNNTFRILDSFASHTSTFDGASATIVNVSVDTITINDHRFVTGQRVTYNDGGGTAIGGLSDGVYYIIKHDRNNIKLASTANNAASGTAINLTGVGVGNAHTLNVAFDGVNTKFKVTHDGGRHGNVTRAAQLMISVNGVVQQPHQTASPSTGFGIDADSVVVFSTAPVTTDTIFGNITASNATSFEISDNDVDNFTGNGSTTAFTMSKIPVDNRNILVTLDGVVQYPSDTSTTRAYDTSGNTITFVSAPGNGVEIQVRHIGFAGRNDSAPVSSVFGKTGHVTLTNSDDITVRNVVGTGLTFADATFSGNVTIGGTLTYDDVTNIDAIGVITARSGIVATGTVSATTFDGAGTSLTGVSTNFVTAVGIQSGGTVIGAGITQLNFIGTGNTFAVSGTTVDISIQGGSAGAGGTWGSNTVGVHTDKIVGVNTTTIAGTATSEGAVQAVGNIAITDGALIIDQNVNTTISVPSGKNALLIGPTTVAAGATIDVAQGSTLVVV